MLAAVDLDGVRRVRFVRCVVPEEQAVSLGGRRLATAGGS